MDSQHRHELGENALAHWLASKIEAIKPQLPLIGIGLGAALVAIAAWSSWSGSSSQIEQAAWEQYSLAVNTPTGLPSLLQLEQIGEDHAGSSVVPWADSAWADGQLATAVGLYFQNRETAEEAATKAEEGYQRLIADRGVPRELRERAQLGLARVSELRGEIDEAIKAYREVRGAFQEIAESRAEQLEDERTRADVAWLASAEAAITRPRATTGDAAARPDATPDAIALPDDTEDASFEEMLKGLSLGGDAPSEDDASGDAGPTGDEEAEAPANDESAGAETPADPSSEAETETPADEPPAEGPDSEESATAEAEGTAEVEGSEAGADPAGEPTADAGGDE